MWVRSFFFFWFHSFHLFTEFTETEVAVRARSPEVCVSFSTELNLQNKQLRLRFWVSPSRQHLMHMQKRKNSSPKALLQLTALRLREIYTFPTAAFTPALISKSGLLLDASLQASRQWQTAVLSSTPVPSRKSLKVEQISLNVRLRLSQEPFREGFLI